MTTDGAPTPPPALDGLARAVERAAGRLAPYGLRTPLLPARSLAAAAPEAYLKCENIQRTGSFKIRGALNKVLALSEAERSAGVVTSSTGNHGLAVAEALRLVGGRGTIVVSSGAAPYKVRRLREAGLHVLEHEGDAMAAELAARAIAEREGLVYISPYNDADVIAGQGTIGLELVEQLPDVEVVYVAVGGGGLVAGMAAALRAVKPSVHVVGCWPRVAPAMHECIRAGRIIDVKEGPTLSDATAGNVEPGAVTLPLCQVLVDEHVLVEEAEIARAMRDVALADHLVVEGSAGVAVAALRRLVRERPELAGAPSVAVLCGGNVSAERLRDVLAAPDEAAASGG